MSDTPETQEAVERWRQGKINIFDEMARLERERDKAHALVAEMKQAIIWAKAEAKERLHRLDQAACERRTWLEAHEKMRRERDEAREDANYAEKESSRMRSALQRLADCDWVITPHDRMDAVRKIARDALEATK